MSLTWDHEDARIVITDLGATRKRVEVEMHDPSLFVADRQCETDYPLDLIALLLRINGPRGLCYEILRDESTTTVQLELELAVSSFVEPRRFVGARVLDFGCGTGASTVILARMFPEVAEVVGVELDEPRLEVAARRASHHDQPNVRFEASPGPKELPGGLGHFDFVILSAVVEHLLPSERRVLLPQLWRLLTSGGILFVNATPHRWFPVEFHTTGLPGLNYVPAPLACRLAVRHSKRSIRPGRTATETWQGLLRGGVRGSTEREIVSILRSAGATPVRLRPRGRSHADIWYEGSMRRHPSRAKSLARLAYAGLGRLSGQPFMPSLMLALRKADV